MRLLWNQLFEENKRDHDYFDYLLLQTITNYKEKFLPQRNNDYGN